jgi:hypothetical protein
MSEPEGKMAIQEKSLVMLLGPQLPCLRRYAHALTGSRNSGDAFVRAVIEVVLQAEDLEEVAPVKPGSEQAGLAPKLLLFTLFHRFWNPHRRAIQMNVAALADLDPRGLEGFWLTAVEGFDLPDAARLLGMSINDARASIFETEQVLAQTALPMAG